MKTRSYFGAFALVLALLSGCATTPTLLPPQAIQSPAPIPDSSGEYVAPYTSDGVVAGWVDKAVNAKMGAAIGGTVGAYAGQKALEQVPFVGGFLGQKAGNAVGRKIAVEASGGWEYIRESSDLSFANAADLSVWMYVNYSMNEHYAEVLAATQEIYPELKQNYLSHILSASNAARASGVSSTMGAPTEAHEEETDTETSTVTL